MLRVSADDLAAAMRLLNAGAIDLHIHVRGDRGFRTALDTVEKVKTELGDEWRIQVALAHAELVDPADMPRVGELGVIVNWTCHWSGGYFGTTASEWLGWDRYDRAVRAPGRQGIALSGIRLLDSPSWSPRVPGSRRVRCGRMPVLTGRVAVRV